MFEHKKTHKTLIWENIKASSLNIERQLKQSFYHMYNLTLNKILINIFAYLNFILLENYFMY